MNRAPALAVLAALSLPACLPADNVQPVTPRPPPMAAARVPSTRPMLANAALEPVCEANVGGAVYDTERDYLPRVVMCENGGAPLEALKAQAIAARTYLYYRMETQGTIGDGQHDQVMTCPRQPSPEVMRAVAETDRVVIRYASRTIAAFYVRGGASAPPGCVGSTSDRTERFVTYNAGRSGASVVQSPLGSVHATNVRNRGCMSQLGSRCLATLQFGYDAILRSYYGEDISVERAMGTCRARTAPPTTPKGPTSPTVPLPLPLPIPIPIPFLHDSPLGLELQHPPVSEPEWIAGHAGLSDSHAHR